MSQPLETNDDTLGERQQLTKQLEANLPSSENGTNHSSVRVLKVYGKKRAQREGPDGDTPDSDGGAISEFQQTTTSTAATTSTTTTSRSLSLIGQLLVTIVGSLVWLLIKLACRLLFNGGNRQEAAGLRHQADDSAQQQSVIMCHAKTVAKTYLSSQNSGGSNGSSSPNKQLVNFSSSSNSSSTGNNITDNNNNNNNGITNCGLLRSGEICHEAAVAAAAATTTTSQEMINGAQSIVEHYANPEWAPIATVAAEATTFATPNIMKHKSTIDIRMNREQSTGTSKVVACFEHQTIANELSAKVIREALEATCQLQQEDTNNMSASLGSKADACTELMIDSKHEDCSNEAGCDEKPEESCQCTEPHDRETNQESSEPIDSQSDHEQEQEQQQEPHSELSPSEVADGQAVGLAVPSPSPPPPRIETPDEQPADSLSSPNQEGTNHQEEAEREHASSDDGEAELENLMLDESVSSASVTSYDDFCGQQASEINLRQLKLSALEDVLVCGENRHSTESARRLFHMLTSSSSSSSPPADGQQKQVQRRQHLRVKKVSGNRKLMASSLSSHSSRADDDEEYYDDEDDNDQEDNCNNNNNNNKSAGHGFYEDIYASQDGNDDDYGTIKIIRRQCCASSNSNWSSSSAAGAPGCNYGRTLVCSVSPVSQLARSASTSSSTASSTRANAAAAAADNNNKWHHQQYSEGQEHDQDYLGPYGIDGDEIRQCKEAFRENKRLIEQVQAIAVKQRIGDQQQQQQQGYDNSSNGASTTTPGLSRSSSQATLQSRLTDRPRWTDSLNRRQQLPNCSRCQKKLYPMDRMELDFTRATLNIHRNCFKCHVCSTLLRLETYASIDTKLYCPAHTKSATITVTQLAPSSAPPPTTSLIASG